MKKQILQRISGFHGKLAHALVATLALVSSAQALTTYTWDGSVDNKQRLVYDIDRNL